MNITLSKVWRPPITHLMDDEDQAGRTLCGLKLTRDWDGGGTVIDRVDIDYGVACGCRRCRAIAEKRYPKEAE
jgi:hypothetical protein